MDPYQTAYDRYLHWHKRNVWDSILSTLQAQADAEGCLSWAFAAMDGMIIAVHPNAGTRGVSAAPAETNVQRSDIANEPTVDPPADLPDEAIGAIRGTPPTKNIRLLVAWPIRLALCCRSVSATTASA